MCKEMVQSTPNNIKFWAKQHWFQDMWRLLLSDRLQYQTGSTVISRVTICQDGDIYPDLESEKQ